MSFASRSRLQNLTSKEEMVLLERTRTNMAVHHESRGNFFVISHEQHYAKMQYDVIEVVEGRIVVRGIYLTCSDAHQSCSNFYSIYQHEQFVMNGAQKVKFDPADFTSFYIERRQSADRQGYRYTLYGVHADMTTTRLQTTSSSSAVEEFTVTAKAIKDVPVTMSALILHGL